jgi:hypothetical protein
VDDERVVVQVSRWRKILATKGTVAFPIDSIVRVEHDPIARAHVKIGIRQWRKHGTGVWRLGVYHGLDGWSFWSIGVGRNTVLIECSGQRYRFVVVEVADPGRTVREIRSAMARAAARAPRRSEPGRGAVAPPSAPLSRRGRVEGAPLQD